ncbi:hypothetical protein QN386_06965 [Pseudomonas sp. CCI3.2]|uniref:hypothetical protein n=1 Tax=unclassified Pseudomonas TaxID=196821 RepID=UPI002B23A394|nr:MULTISPECIES: hypothetical protein [unclassified Pseudomonas]MEB0076294.1 hypothetical protein [Pseudomonas sp. MH10out]MEB0101067.1 hypothetical protein [Pseudomonas sp. CCI3.2]MEB0128926.1 hypothetical protein [Pseudomonas sp. CCI2.4]
MRNNTYRLLHHLNHTQAAAWLYEITGSEIDPAMLAQICADSGTPAELDVTKNHLEVGRQSVDAIGLHSVVKARIADQYVPSIRFVVELEDGRLAEGIADLRYTPLLFRPTTIEALACKIKGIGQQDAIEVLQQKLESERAARIAAEEELADFRAKPLDPRERASLERLIYLLSTEAGYKLSQPHKAEEIIQQEAARRGLKVPSGKGTIAKQLEAAEQRAKMDAEP